VRFAARSSEPSGFGLAPLLYVVLLLLIFFVVTTTFTVPRLALDLPDAETGSPGPRSGLAVTISPSGAITVDGEPVTGDALDARLVEAAQRDEEVQVRADDGTRHGAVVDLLDRARRSGVRKIGIAVAPGAEPGAREAGAP